MNPYLISRSFGELKQTIRTRESRKIIARIVSFTELLKTRGKSILVWMVYRRSEGVLLAKKFGGNFGYVSNRYRLHAGKNETAFA